MRRNGRNQVLKARACMQGKIRDLEDRISAMNTEHAEKVIFYKTLSCKILDENKLKKFELIRCWELKVSYHLNKCNSSDGKYPKSIANEFQIEHLNASIETLRADREWTLEENARLLKILGSYKYVFTNVQANVL